MIIDQSCLINLDIATKKLEKKMNFKVRDVEKHIKWVTHFFGFVLFFFQLDSVCAEWGKVHTKFAYSRWIQSVGGWVHDIMI